MTRPTRSEVARDAPFLQRDEVRLVGKAGIPRDLPRLAPKMSAHIVDEGNEGAGVGGVGHEAVRHNHLMRGVDRDLTVVALHEPVARGQDAAVRVGEVALRPVGRTAILTAQWPALPAQA